MEEVMKESKKFIDSNKNANTTYQYLWDTMEADLGGEFISTKAYTKKLESSKISILIICLGALEK